MKIQHPNGQFHISKAMYENLEHMKTRIANDWDVVVTMCGYPGTGKSLFAQQLAYFLDKDFSIDNIVFSVEDFEAAIDKHRNTVIIWDEAGDAASAHHLSKEARSLQRKLSVCRHRNLILFILYPNFFEIPKPIALYRSLFMIRVYDIWGKRGQYQVFGRREKLKLYMKGKKEHDYGKQYANFTGTFSGFKVLDWEAYEKKKTEEEQKRHQDKPEGRKAQRHQAQFASLVDWVIQNHKLTHKELAELITKRSGYNIHRSTISKLIAATGRVGEG